MPPIRLTLACELAPVRGYAGEGACDSRDPQGLPLAYAHDSEWRTAEVSS